MTKKKSTIRYNYLYSDKSFRQLDALVESASGRGANQTANLLVDLGREDEEKFRVTGAMLLSEGIYEGGTVPDNLEEKFID